MAASPTAETMETLSANIGEVVYIDIAKWHLYLNDAKLHSLVAQRLYPLVEAGRISETEVTKALQDIPVPIGGGDKQIPLMDLVPKRCMGDLIRVLEDFQDKL